MSYYSYCAACTYMSEEPNYSGKYWCSVKGEDRYASDSKCYEFIEAYSRSSSTISNMIDNSQGHMSSGCYLTTAMCEILGYPDNNYYLNTLRKFRDEVMKKNPNYILMLITYDQIGPMIAYNLSKDKDRLSIAMTLFSRFIVPSCDAIEDEKYTAAISSYLAMTTELAKKYNIDINMVEPHIDNLNMEFLGHARTKRISK